MPFLEHLQSSQDFKNDLSMSQYAWFYTNDAAMRRVLLVQDKEAGIKDIRKLGSVAAKQLQAKKATDIEIIASNEFDASELG